MHVFDINNKGKFVTVSDNDTVARKEAALLTDLIFSKNYISPGEIVSTEIIETQRYINGELRVGFVLLAEDDLDKLPSFTINDLTAHKPCWLFRSGVASTMLALERERIEGFTAQQLDNWSIVDGIMDSSQNFPRSFQIVPELNAFEVCIPGPHPCSCCLRTAHGTAAISDTVNDCIVDLFDPRLRVGSRVSFYYELTPTTLPLKSQRAVQSGDPYEMTVHIVMKGIDLMTLPEIVWFTDDQMITVGDQSNGVKKIPKLKAVFELYGQIRTIQLLQLSQQRVPPLSRLCRCAIVNMLLRAHCTEHTPVHRAMPGTMHLPFDIEDHWKYRQLFSVLFALPIPKPIQQMIYDDLYAVLIRDL